MSIYGFYDDSPRHWCPNCEHEQPHTFRATVYFCQDETCPRDDTCAPSHRSGTDSSELVCCICGLPAHREDDL